MKKIFAKIIKKILKAVASVVVFIFHFIPRDKHLWLTGKVSSWYDGFTPPDFFDNSKYFYLYLVNHTKEKVYWITSSKKEYELLKKLNLPVVKFYSIRGIYLVLRAKFFFHHYGIDQINSLLQAGAVQIDFWHGVPFKKIRYDVVTPEKIEHNFFWKIIHSGDIEFVASTSQWLTKKILSRAFLQPEENFLNYGLPRNDVLKFSEEELIEFCKKYSRNLLKYIETAKQYEQVFLYMPTWRDDDPDYFSKANIDFKRLSDKLKEINGVMFVKLHPLTKKVNIGTYENIIQISNDVDIYPFLSFIKFLITDYSSIFFDYLLLDKEIIFIPYDIDNYVAHRELYFDYDIITPGKKYCNFDEFIDDINKISLLNYHDDRQVVKEKMMKEDKFDACECTYNYLVRRYRNEDCNISSGNK